MAGLKRGHMGWFRAVTVAAVTAGAVAVAGMGATSGQAATRQPGVVGASDPDRIPGRYVVVLDGGVTISSALARAERSYGASVDDVYRSAVRGYSARMTRAEARDLARAPGVSVVQTDTRVHTTAQPLPSGINRANADASRTARINRRDQRVNVDVAVIDTGVAFNHPDLRVRRAGARNCSTGRGANDQNGHGTHVAGTIAALDNRRGVVGMAPGARIWPVRVLDRAGSGSISNVICGIDYVTRRANRIDVANLSLGGSGQDDGSCGNRIPDALHRAICRSVRAGVTYVAAAGNSARNAGLTVPAAYDEVITVSAMADFNGRPGGRARATCRPDVDDTFAGFSNFGRDVDLVAPGVCIRSTWPNGRYRTHSGTSMAAPHVAGGAALFLARHPRATPARVRAALRAAGSNAWNAADDRDAVKEPLLNVSRF